MGNVLAELFQDQANAIREGLGDIGKFPPAEFAERIRDIVALIGTGGGSGDSGGTGGGESGGTGGGTGTGLKVTTGIFQTPDYDFQLDVRMNNFVPSDRYPGLHVYEVSPAILPLGVGDGYYFKLFAKLSSPPSGGAAIFSVLGTYRNCYACGNFGFLDADYDGAGHDDSCPYLLIYSEEEDKNIIFTSVLYPNATVSFLKLGAVTGTKTILHGMSSMPDLIYVYHNDFASALIEGPPGNALLAAAGVKSDFEDYFGEKNSGFVCFSGGGLYVDTGIDEADISGVGIRCRNDTTFIVGNNSLWFPGSTYTWVAISGLGSSGGGDVVIEGVDPYYQQLAEALMVRDAKYLGDNQVLNLKSFKTSDGHTLGTLNSYSLAGFDEVKGILLTDTAIVLENALVGCSNLKIIDVTASNNVNSVGFMSGSLIGCDALESIIVRDGGSELSMVAVVADNGGNNDFYVYVPISFYDSIIAKLSATHIDASRYRKLEDYPLIDFWNETFTVKFYDGDELLKTAEVKCGESVSYTLEKEGAVFMGWVPEPTEVVGNMECHAKWLVSHAVRFWDGDTLLKEVKVEDGGSTSFSYEKDGYKFLSWSQEAVNVTEDMDIYGTWAQPFADATWEEIDTICSKGFASAAYSLGDAKEISFTGPDGSNYTMPVEIIAFGEDTLQDGSAAGITVRTKYTAGWAYMNSGTVTAGEITNKYYAGGWELCEVRSKLATITLPSMDSGLQGAIKSTRKVSNKYVGNKDKTGQATTYDKLWLFSASEVSAYEYTNVGIAIGEGNMYSSFKNGKLSRNMTNLAGSKQTYHLRTGSYTNADNSTSWNSSTSKPVSNNARSGNYIVFGFCI